MPFDPFKDLVPVTSLVSNQIVLAVNPSLPANNLREFVELARAQQAAAVLCVDRQRQQASSGDGDAQAARRHRSDPRAVSRRRAGGDRAARRRGVGDVRRRLGGADDQSGKLRGLASTGKVRNPATPELPTIAEIYPGYEALIWHGLFVPAGTPQPIIDRLRNELNAVAGAARVQGAARPTPAPASPTWSSPEELAARIKTRLRKIRQADPLDRREGGAERLCCALSHQGRGIATTAPSSRRSRR